MFKVVYNCTRAAIILYTLYRAHYILSHVQRHKRQKLCKTTTLYRNKTRHNWKS